MDSISEPQNETRGVQAVKSVGYAKSAKCAFWKVKEKVNKLHPTVQTCALWVLLLVCGGAQIGGTAPAASRKEEALNLQNKFANSLNLSRKLLIESRALTQSYKLWKLPGSHLDFVGSAHTFPSLSISSRDWLKLQKGDRLRLLNEALRVFPAFLKVLEKREYKEKGPLLDQIISVRLDLRDLLQHIRLQMENLGVRTPGALTTPLVSGREWCNRLLTYQALRRMEMTMQRAVREFTALRLAAN
ncbi:interleukin-27 subunit alpha [Pelodytes ibericus]